MRRKLTGMLLAGILLTAMAVHEARAGGIYFYYGPSYYRAPVYVAPVVRPVTVYRPSIYIPPAYPVVVTRPVVPAVYTAPPVYAPFPTTVRVRHSSRKVETKYYTPYGTHEYEVKYDRWGNVRDIDYDFDR